MAQTLEANMNVIGESGIELELIDGDLNIIQKLDDEPNDVGGLTSAQLKAKFDEAGNRIKEYINGKLVPAVLAADATELSRAAAEQERITNEYERVANEAYRFNSEKKRQENEQRREDLESGYVARAESAAKTAQDTAKSIGSVAEEVAQVRTLVAQAQAASDQADDRAGEAAGYAVSAQQSAQKAVSAAGAAGIAAEIAAESVEQYPRIGENGNWQVWDFPGQCFVDSGNPSRGADGKNGADGKDGEKGADGKDGADGYTPVKGVDYYTQAEKAQLVSEVLGSLDGETGGAGEKVDGQQFVVDNTVVTAGEGAERFNDYTNNIAAGSFSHAEGEYTVASGDRSHAEGWLTRASGSHSHAEGASAVASGSASHAEGTFTVAAGSNQHVQGFFNIETTDHEILHIVGNGAGRNARSNAHTLDVHGNAWFSGDVYVGSDSGTNKDDGSKKLATEEYVQSVAGSGGVSSWNDLTDRPFYEEGGLVEVLPETALNIDDDGYSTIETALVFAVGDSYTVKWNGVEYTCVAQDASAMHEGAVVIGNGTRFGLPGNNEPFGIVSEPQIGTLVQTLIGTTSATISIYRDDIIIHKLDGRYLPRGVPYMEGEDAPVLPETTAEFSKGQVTGREETFLAAAPELTVGKTYLVTWNGVEYECVCQYLTGNRGGVYMEAIVVGNCALFGAPETGEPFLIGNILQPMSASLAVSFVGSGPHTFKIDGGYTAHRLDRRCLPAGMPVLYTVTISEEGIGVFSADKSVDELFVRAADPNAIVRAFMPLYGSTAVVPLAAVGPGMVEFRQIAGNGKLLAVNIDGDGHVDVTYPQ